MQSLFSTRPTLAALLVSATISVAPALAQGNDECAGAIPVTTGANGPFTNVGMTTSTPAFSCVPTGGNDMWFSYVASCDGEATISLCGADYDSCIEVYSGACGSLASLACNDDFCSLQSQVTIGTVANTTYYIRVGGWNSATGNFPINIDCNYPFRMQGIAEATLGGGTMNENGSVFRDLDFLRWNYIDPQNLSVGKFAAAVFNLGTGGTPPTGVSLSIPGFEQVWAGSTPSGFAVASALAMIPATDQSFQIPPGFMPADTMRLQALLLDPVNAPGSLPVVPSQNTIRFVKTGTCAVSEGFEGLAQGSGIYPTGWSNGGGSLEWRVDCCGTPSSGTGPSAAFEGVNYMYCETSSPATTGSTWIMNTGTYSSAGLSAVGFALSRVGDSIGTLEVRMGDGTGAFPTLLGTYNGTGPEWSEEVLGLGSNPPANVQFQFHYTYGGSFRGDIAIDKFCLQ